VPEVVDARMPARSRLGEAALYGHALLISTCSGSLSARNCPAQLRTDARPARSSDRNTIASLPVAATMSATASGPSPPATSGMGLFLSGLARSLRLNRSHWCGRLADRFRRSPGSWLLGVESPLHARDPHHHQRLSLKDLVHDFGPRADHRP
jgi:hypothetical protein